MELYTDSHPALVSDRVIEYFDKFVENMQFENKSFFQKLFDNVIYPNWGIWLVILSIIIFLVYRYYYYGKKEKFEKT